MSLGQTSQDYRDPETGEARWTTVESGQPGGPAYAESREVRSWSPAMLWSGIIYLAASVVEVLLAIRWLLKLFAANAQAAFSTFIYSATSGLVAPFQGLFHNPATGGGGVIEVTTLVAIVVYALAAALVIQMVRLIWHRTTSVSKRRVDRPAPSA